MSLLHFILIYDHEKQELLRAQELGTQTAQAAQEYARVENEYRHREGIEIVLVGADSLDTIRQTHAHYFAASATEPFGELLPVA